MVEKGLNVKAITNSEIKISILTAMIILNFRRVSSILGAVYSLGKI
ncbi:hypothetical protein PU02_1279 [Bartonella ancashensis]|uniref:Uncharacterized protein n=1 Tax=Bartonella ancashensis TaxID=1318743 RepID=A0A0M4LJP3_9HYPH|nr:hypothetical protein PU02_1279 [Bartonella ancashensis]